MTKRLAKKLRGTPKGIGAEIRDRLADSVEAAERNPATRAFVNAAAWIADEIRRDIGASWKTNAKSRAVLIAAIQSWIEINADKIDIHASKIPGVSDLFGPDDPATLGRAVARHYTRWTAEAEKSLGELKSAQEKRDGKTKLR